MRILVFGLSQQRGGVESFVMSYCDKIVKIDSSVRFEYLVIDEIPQYALEAGIPKTSFLVVPSRTRAYFSYRRELRCIFEQGHYDCLWYNVCTLSDITPVKIAHDLGVSVVLHSHNSENMGNLLNGILHAAHKRRIGKFADLFVACSQAAGNFLFPPNVLGGDSFFVLPNAIDVERFRFDPDSRKRIREESGVSLDALVFGHVGRFHFQKNHEYLIRVFAEVHRCIPNSKLLLVGSGELVGRIKGKVFDLGISDAVIFAGETNNVAGMYSAMDCFLFPSVFEGFGLAALEAQASGLPCIVSEECEETPLATEICRKVSVKADPKKWANAAIELVAETREDRLLMAEVVKAQGYDLSSSAAKALSLFKLCKENR